MENKIYRSDDSGSVYETIDELLDGEAYGAVGEYQLVRRGRLVETDITIEWDSPKKTTKKTTTKKTNR